MDFMKKLQELVDKAKNCGEQLCATQQNTVDSSAIVEHLNNIDAQVSEVIAQMNELEARLKKLEENLNK